MATKRLYRSTEDKMIAGVCGGLAEYFGIDAVIVRVIAVVLLLAGSAGFWVYIILWIVVPKRPDLSET
ncbi:MAG TPA: PspC domain-containing protein [Candidatus Saccharimonadales bacterium]|nr:PspC domain-containing protein [Candidatus Saccharimonadales bacterium]